MSDRYKAAYIKAEVEVTAYDEIDQHAAGILPHTTRTQRVVKVSLSESFGSTEQFHQAVDALAATIKEAATR